MPADAFWTLAMAFNVYLTFYYKFDAQKLRRMEIPYLICCYGVPFIVALTYIFVTSKSQGRMYGNATLWCWVSSEWDIMRIATFYGPVWVVILITFFIYLRAGREIYKKHKQLRNFGYSSHPEPDPLPPMDDPYGASKTTEVFVTTEIINTHQQPAIDLAPLGRRGEAIASNAPKVPPVAQPRSGSSAASHQTSTDPAYSVTISSSKRPNSFASPSNPDSFNNVDFGDAELQAGSKPFPMEPATAVTAQGSSVRHATTVTSARPITAPTINGPRNPVNQRQRRRVAYEANSAAWSYTKCAILFFTAMLVTWIPSSANRVFSVVHVDRVSVPLEYMSAFVLPLQGFWNAIIYVVTSWKACQTLWDESIWRRVPRKKQNSHEPQNQYNRHQSQLASQYQRKSSFGGASPATSDSAPSLPSTSRSKSIMLETSKETTSQSAFHRMGSSNGSDELLDQMVGGRSTAPKSEKSYESDSVKELALSRSR